MYETRNARLDTTVHEEGEGLSEVNVGLLHVLDGGVLCNVLPRGLAPCSLDQKLLQWSSDECTRARNGL